MSLSGSVDPAAHPEHLLRLDSAPVRALAERTGQHEVAAIFGLAERGDGGACHITQAFARAGELAGVYRKRQLADDEQAYTPGTEPALFTLGTLRFGIAICAEGGVDFPFDEPAAAGAEVIFFCAAPGLYGRRTSQESWRAGHAWWESWGLAAASRHAARTGTWAGGAADRGPADWYRCAVTQFGETSPEKSEMAVPGQGQDPGRRTPARRTSAWRTPARSRANAPEETSWFHHKAWLLLTVPLGLTTWAAFLYVGIRARRPQWIGFAALYAATMVGYLILDTPAHPSGPAMGVAAALALLNWIGGGIHALAISSDAVRRIQGRSDPLLDAARTRIERRAAGRHLLATQPALAKEVGLGRPDIAGSDDYGLVDVNHAPAAALAKLPGMTRDLAAKCVAERGPAGGFSSVEDLGLLLDLPPDTVDQMRDSTVFIPD